MRKEVELWWDQGKKDFEVARKNFQLKEYYVTAFFCQQAVEKSLKALFIQSARESPGPTHSLLFLATRTRVPRRFFEFLKDLAPEFVTTRYPDIADESPYKLYSEQKAKIYLQKSEELLRWISDQIKK